MKKVKTIKDHEQCVHFDRCSQNLCPLDPKLNTTYGKAHEKCRYMQKARKVKIGKREFISGGTIMPDTSLKFVPQSNVEWLNEASKQRWHEINKYLEIWIQ